MAKLQEIVSYANELLEIDRFSDYCPNGLQVEGRSEIAKIVCGVTASQAVIDAAVAASGDLLLVHHGFFWKGEQAVLTGMKRRRIHSLLSTDLSLLAYHLPLDAHPEYGNNATLADVLGLKVTGRTGPGDIVYYGELDEPSRGEQLAARISKRLGRAPLHIAGNERIIKTVAWCTGGAQGFIDMAIDLGVDAYITGEVSEQTYHTAIECGIHFFAAGHHATERYGVQALGRHLAAEFGAAYAYVELENPV